MTKHQARQLAPGDKVTYIAPHRNDYGVFKRFHTDGDIAYVVFNCGGNWDRYANYTAQAVNITDLHKGWD